MLNLYLCAGVIFKYVIWGQMSLRICQLLVTLGNSTLVLEADPIQYSYLEGQT